MTPEATTTTPCPAPASDAAAAGQRRPFPWRSLTPTTVLALQSYRSDPSVSLLLTTRPGARLDPADRETLARLLRQAQRRLAVDASPAAGALTHVLTDGVDRLTGPFDRALALLASPARTARVNLPVGVVDRCVVDPTFATRDLVRALHRTPRHVLLLLADGRARLFDGGNGSLTEITAGFPRHDTRHRPGTPARDAFLRGVDAALGTYLRLHPAPMIIGGPRDVVAAFRELSQHTRRLAGTVLGVDANTPPGTLQRRVRDVVEDYLLSRQAEALDLLLQRSTEGRAAHGIDAAWTAARQGRPEMLAVEQGFFHPARISADGDTLSPADDPEAPDVCDDAVDELIETVITRGGWIALLHDHTLPRHTRVALTLHR